METELKNMATEEELEESLLIEALHQHLAYVESRLLEIGQQIQQREKNAPEKTTVKNSHFKKKKKLVLPPVRSPSPPPKIRLPRASDLTRVSLPPKPALPEKERELRQKKKIAAKQKALKHLAVLKALEQLKCEYRQQYTALMARHVAEQKQQMRERDRRWEKKITSRREKEQRLRHARKPLSFRSSAVADYSFLNNLHQSNFYKIVSAELELRKKGMLTTLQDIKYFWDQMLQDGDDGSDQNESGLANTSSLYLPSRSFSQPGPYRRSVLERPVLEAAYEEEEEEEGSGHSWAITALPRETSQRKTAEQTEVSADSSPQVSQVFEPLKIPAFKPLSQIMGGSARKENRGGFPGQDSHLAKVEDIQRKTRERERMFQTSRSNQLIMTRLMEKLDLDPILALPETVALSTSSVATHPMYVFSQPAAVQPRTALSPPPALPPIPDHTTANTHGPSTAAAGTGELVLIPLPTTTTEAPLLVGETSGVPIASDLIFDQHQHQQKHRNDMLSSCSEILPPDHGTTVDEMIPTLTSSHPVPAPAVEEPPAAVPLPPPARSPAPVLVPLSMEALQSSGAVRVGRKTALWSNYVLAGQ